MYLTSPRLAWTIDRAHRLISEHRNTVVFVTPLLRPREIKMATALRAVGWQVILLYKQTTPFVPADFFDIAINLPDDDLLHRVAKILKPRLCHVFSGAVDDALLKFCRAKPAPIIIDLNDIFCPSLFNYLQERFEPTRECLGLADALCCRDLQPKYAERFDGFRLPEKILMFPEYPWMNGVTATGAQPNRDPDEIRIVSVGTFTLETKGMFDSAYLQLARKLAEQKIHLHIYPHWFYRDTEGSVFRFDQQVDFADFLALEKETPYLHLHNSLPVDELARELPQYDFGIVSGGCEELGQKLNFLTERYMQCCYSGRIADYLDARLPILINPEVGFNYRLLKRYGVGIDLHGLLQPGFRDKLMALKRGGGQKRRIDDAVKRLDLTRQSKRLADFYETLIEEVPRPDAHIPFWMHAIERIPVLGNSTARIISSTRKSASKSTMLKRNLEDPVKRRSHQRGLKNAIASVQRKLDQVAAENRDLQMRMAEIRQELKLGGTQVDEIVGLLNWPALADEGERTQGFAELMRIMGLFLANNYSAGTAGTQLDLSEAWRLLNRKNLDQLATDGYRQFKRTIALNYFTFPIQEGDAQIATLEARVGATEAQRLWSIAKDVPDDSDFALQPQTYFRYLTLLLWSHARSIDTLKLLQSIEEPSEGNPVLVPIEGYQASQDLANSTIELYSMAERFDFSKPGRILEIGGGYGRNAYVIAKAYPHIQLVLVDVPPAIYIAQRYLCSVLSRRPTFRVQRFDRFADVRDEIEAASLVFLLPHQLSMIPKDYFTLAINISSFGEMTRDQIETYFAQIERTTRGVFYNKQWLKSLNPFDKLTLTETDYPYRQHWRRLFSRPCATNEAFFEAIHETGAGNDQP